MIGTWLLWKAARSATSARCRAASRRRWNLVEMVGQPGQGIIHNANSRKFVALAGAHRKFARSSDERYGLAAIDLIPASGNGSTWCRRPRPATTRLHARRHGRPFPPRWSVGLGAAGVHRLQTSRSRVKAAGYGAVHRSVRRASSLWPANSDADDRNRRQDRLARYAVVRQHVRGRTRLHAHRPHKAAMPVAGHPAAHRPDHRGFHLAIFHYPDHHLAGLFISRC